MKVILRKNYEQLGKIGDIVEVKDGFALNFLIPRQIAYFASKGNIKALEEEKKLLAKREALELEAAQELAGKLAEVSVLIPVKVGEDDRLFGTVTSQQIGEALAEKGFEIDKRKIEIDEPIKALGTYEVKIKLHPEVEAVVKTWVSKE